MKRFLCLAPLLLAGCTYSKGAALDRCLHSPGCTTSAPVAGFGPAHQAAAAPANANLPR